MKKISFIIIILAAALAYVYAGGDMESGNIVSTERTFGQFDSIKAGSNGTVNFHESPEYRATIAMDSGTIDYLDIYTSGSCLNIGIKPGHPFFFGKYNIDVYCPTLSTVNLSGSVQFKGIDKIKAGDFSLKMSGSGKADGDFECSSFSLNVSGSVNINGNVASRNFSADLSGSSRIKLAGQTDDMDIRISGSTIFNGKDLQSKNTQISASGSSNMDVWVLDNLKTQVTGSGRIRYRGNPKIDNHSSGSASLENIT
ncbi:MAG: DUF2807 domain-containing protein [Treponema sp.]|nr:DUF2807 domain-containing protein [Treponema sp.]